MDGSTAKALENGRAWQWSGRSEARRGRAAARINSPRRGLERFLNRQDAKVAKEESQWISSSLPLRLFATSASLR
jgi:hypothetical protein